jgi:hypothetical protein
MIDFTTIDANPIPPSVLKLQKENARLLKQQTQLRTFAKLTVGFALICLTALLIERQKSEKNATQRQPYN